VRLGRSTLYPNDGVIAMLEWPGRCGNCNETIDDWSDAGLFDRQWIHKACYSARWTEAHSTGADLTELRSPVERIGQLEWPMLFFILLFHFGLGGVVIGWIMLDQNQSPNLGVVLLVLGVIVPLIGIAGIALNIIGRRRIESIRQELELAGGWKPGR
jgi:hypothetical protein